MAGLNYDTVSHTGLLTINSVSMHCAAWCMLDLTELWGFNRGSRLNNVDIPEVAGSRAYQPYAAEAKHSLEMAITGLANSSGVAPAAGQEWAQLRANIDYLASTLPIPTTGAAYVAASLAVPGASARTANIQVAGINLGTRVGRYTRRATLNIVIPAGVFA